MVNGHTVALFTRSFKYWQFPWGRNNYLMPLSERGKLAVIRKVTGGLREQGIVTELDERSFSA